MFTVHTAQQQMYANEKKKNYCVRIVEYYTTHCVLRLSLCSQLLCRYLSCFSFLCSRRWSEKNSSFFFGIFLLQSTEKDNMNKKIAANRILITLEIFPERRNENYTFLWSKKITIERRKKNTYLSTVAVDYVNACRSNCTIYFHTNRIH